MTYTLHDGRQHGAMKRPVSHRQLLRFVAIPVFVALAGCVTGPKVKALPDSVKSDLSSLAIAPTTKPLGVTVWRPSAMSGARDGAKTAIEVANVLTLGLWPIAFYGAGTAAVPTLGAGIGLVLAIINGPSSKEVERAESALRGFVEQTSVAKVVGDTMVAQLREMNPQMRTLVVDYADENRSTSESLKAQGISAILELEVTNLQVGGPWGSDPRGTISMTVTARIVRTADGALVYSQDFEFAGNHEVGDWFQTSSDELNGPQLLREALIDAAETLARDIARAIFAPRETSSDAPISGETQRGEKKILS